MGNPTDGDGASRDPLTYVFKLRDDGQLVDLREDRYWGFDQAVNLQTTNPDLELHPLAYRAETAFTFNTRIEPWSDIRVRQALSMAIDFDAIAENYMRGWGDASPVGIIGKAVLGYFMPFEEWPDELKQYYRYDPEAAEELLDEAGYPRGADGVRFSTVYEHYEFFDLGYYQIAMDYLRKIGIDVEIRTLRQQRTPARSRPPGRGV